jgi:hypothetical protein
MRFMVLVKANADSESGRLPTAAELSAMTTYNEELVRNGIMLAGEGLQPSSQGLRIRYDKTSQTVIDGPFSETKELVAGWWILQCKSLDECVEWVKRAPFQEGEVEIRRISEAADFGELMTPEMREREAKMGAQIQENRKA